MRPNLEVIDEYMNGELSETQKQEVEKQIATDQVFAKDFAMMLLAKKAAKEVADLQRKKDFESLRSGIVLEKQDNIFSKRYVKVWAVAASLALIIGFFWIFNTSESTEQLADNYIKTQLETLPVLMGTEEDSLQKGLGLYNKKSYQEAYAIFEKIAPKDSKALEYLGLAALQLEKYEVAIKSFEKLSIDETYKSRAKLLQALTYIKKGQKDKSFEIIKGINKKDLSIEDREFIEDMALQN
ncbi:MAG: hypothetical protein V4683_16410 [Bacteroidota bacterium]